jgi:hypothetical protein
MVSFPNLFTIELLTTPDYFPASVCGLQFAFLVSLVFAALRHLQVYSHGRASVSNRPKQPNKKPDQVRRIRIGELANRRETTTY